MHESISPSASNMMSTTPIPEEEDVLNAVPLPLDHVMESDLQQEEEKIDFHGPYHRSRRSVSIPGLAIHDSLTRKKPDLTRMGRIYGTE